MSKILENVSWAFTLGVLLSVLALFGFYGDSLATTELQVLQYIHTFLGVLWIGLLYYFNLVQIPTMPSVPAELKPGVSKYIAPAALFWFRWSAAGTVLLGLVMAYRAQYLVEALMLREGYLVIGTGMWLGLVMAFNVWFIIWPNQQKALGLVEADADTKAKSARIAMLTSRTNFVLSLPMLFAMTTYKG